VIVISDTSPLRYLIAIGHVDKLTQETNFRVSPMVIEAIRSQL
jgi:hypothetical protein